MLRQQRIGTVVRKVQTLMMTGAANIALVKVQAQWLDLVVKCGGVTRQGMRGYRGQPV